MLTSLYTCSQLELATIHEPAVVQIQRKLEPEPDRGSSVWHSFGLVLGLTIGIGDSTIFGTLELELACELPIFTMRFQFQRV